MGVESMSEFVQRRSREVARRGQDETDGREVWATSTRTGANLAAARPSDVVALGARAGQRAAPPRPTSASSAISYGALRAPVASPTELAELRRQQAAFGKVVRDTSNRNSWLAVPALAPVAVVAALEAGAATAAALAGPQLKRLPLHLVGREPLLRVGDNWSTRAGRLAHKAFGERVDAKPGWKSEASIPLKDGRLVRPDARTPPRTSASGKSRLLELKPDTPSGRAAGARASKRYQEQTGMQTRTVYYKPRDHM